MAEATPISIKDPDVDVVLANFEQVKKIDQSLVLKAIEKLEAGKNPSAREMEALRRAIRTCGEASRDLIYRTVPIKYYAEKVGLTMTEIKEQADLYGLPLHGPTVDLGKLILRFHDLLETRNHKRG